jgi:hypothetical protein
MAEHAIRFVLGGFVVSAFAMLSDMLRPKSLAFALFFWLTVEESVPLAFLGATVAWTATSITAWRIYKRSPWRRLSWTNRR